MENAGRRRMGWQAVSQSSRRAARRAGKPNLIVRDENEMLMCSRCLRNSIINVCGGEAASSFRYHATQASLGIEKLTVCLKRWQGA